MVIGRVTLSHTIPSLEGARWLMVKPLNGSDLPHSLVRPASEFTGGKEPSLVIYDSLGGKPGDTVGFVEGREAASPFDKPPPIDAINAALIDEIFHSPLPGGAHP